MLKRKSFWRICPYRALTCLRATNKGLAESIGRGRYRLTLHKGLLHADAPAHKGCETTREVHRPGIRIRKTRRSQDVFIEAFTRECVSFDHDCPAHSRKAHEGHPHIIPVCYVYDGQAFYTALDAKPKLVAPERLARVRHIQAQPTVALLIDEYQEDWRQLWYVLIRGTAALLSETDRGEQAKARRLLKAKYPSYDAGLLPDGTLIIRILPTRITSWGKL